MISTKVSLQTSIIRKITKQSQITPLSPRGISLFLLVFSLIFAVTGCGNMFQPETPKPQAQPASTPATHAPANGTLSFSINSVGGSNLARTANPSALAADLSSITLTGSLDGGSSETLGTWSNYSSMSSAISSSPISLLPGDWSFTLSATLNGCQFSGTETATIESEENTSLSFSLSLADNSINYGGIYIKLNYNATTEPTYITAQLTNMSGENVGSAVTLTPDTSTSQHFVEFTRNISSENSTSGRITSGTYRLKIKFYAVENASAPTANNIPLNEWTGLVNVASGFISKYTQNINLNQLYTINYNHNGGDFEAGTAAPEAYSIFRTYTSTTLPNSAKTGYTFAGWYSDSSCTTAFTFAATPSTGNTMNVYAKWTINSYTVTFDTNGGSTIASQTVNYNEHATAPSTNPTKTNSAFGGWCSDAAGETSFDFTETPITAATTIYAKWNPIYATIDGVNYGTLADTITAIKTAATTADITVTLTSNVMQAALGKADTADTIAYAIKNTTANSVSVVVPATETIAISGDASYIFKNCSKLVSADLRGFDTENATMIYGMFCNCSSLTSVNLSSFNTENVTNMMALFEGCSSLTSVDIGNFVTNEVDGISMHAMFQDCSSLTSIDLRSFDTSKADSFTNMFTNCTSLTQLDISNFTLSDNANALNMFSGCSNLEMIIVSNEFAAAMSNLSHSYSQNMFEGCTKLVGANGTEYDSNYTDSTYARLDVAGTPGYFTPASDYAVVNGAEYVDLTDITSAITSATGDLRIILGASITADDIGTGQQGSGMDDGSIVYAIHTLEQNQSEIRVSLIVKEDANIHLNENCSGMFSYCKFDTLDLRGVDTSQVTSMEHMFDTCKCRKSLNISNFDTSSVQNMSYMFNVYNISIEENSILDISSFDLSNVNNVEYMFYGCTTLTTIIVSDSFEVPSGANSNQMFYSCSSIVGGAETTYDDNQIDATYAHIDGGIDNPGYFTAAQ